MAPPSASALPRPWWAWLTVLAGGVGLALWSLAGSAQQLQVWPGFHDSAGPTIEIETEDNVRCRFSQGARPSFNVAGLSTNPGSSGQASSGNASGSPAGSQLGGGIVLSIPFGGTSVDGCGRLSALQERRSKLALGAALLEQGLISQEQFQQLGASIARDLGIPAATASGMPSKPVYVPASPLKIGPAPGGDSKAPSANRPKFSPVKTDTAPAPQGGSGHPKGAAKAAPS
jgi:hypothetical protein